MNTSAGKATRKASVLNDFLQCELSAIRTYHHAQEHLDAKVIDAATLRLIAADHRAAADAWRECVRQAGGEPARDAGVWGVWCEAVESTAGVVGPVAELNALRQEEEDIASRYEEALKSPDLDESTATRIREEWLPRTRRHLRRLPKS